MSDIAIEISNLSKIYRLGEIGTGTLSHDLNRWWHRLRRKEDPYLRIGEENKRNAKGTSDWVWALKDVSFNVTKGEVLGIIGKNGAGKSTLLKLLSRVTAPTTGEIKARGRIASLLEVGTGFHPELTGRDNIYLNGAILGMTKREITSKFDAIVDFSGVERYIDTPVKRYSSGMYVRLAFAVAAYLEPEILIVDEVLAVGDAEFQNKCIGKIKDVSDSSGRTVLFVSHNMGAIRTLCKRSIVLKNGSLIYDDVSEKAISYYLSAINAQAELDLKSRTDREGSGKLRFTNITFLHNGEQVDTVISGDSITIKVDYEVNGTVAGSKFIFAINFFDSYKNMVGAFISDEMGITFNDISTAGSISCHIPKLLLRSARYSLRLLAFEGSTRTDDTLDIIEDAAYFRVEAGDFWSTGNKNREGEFALMPGTLSQSMEHQKTF